MADVIEVETICQMARSADRITFLSNSTRTLDWAMHQIEGLDSRLDALTDLDSIIEDLPDFGPIASAGDFMLRSFMVTNEHVVALVQVKGRSASTDSALWRNSPVKVVACSAGPYLEVDKRHNETLPAEFGRPFDKSVSDELTLNFASSISLESLCNGGVALALTISIQLFQATGIADVATTLLDVLTNGLDSFGPRILTQQDRRVESTS